VWEERKKKEKRTNLIFQRRREHSAKGENPSKGKFLNLKALKL